MTKTFVLIFARNDEHLPIKDGKLIKINVKDVLSFGSLFDEDVQGLITGGNFLQFEWEVSFVLCLLFFVVLFFFSDFPGISFEDLLEGLLFECLFNFLDEPFAFEEVLVPQVLDFIDQEAGSFDLFGFKSLFDFRKPIALQELISQQFG